ncbi:very short patch repair endonuclease [Pseudonocardia sp. Cha107L01]|uniref:very short patch repair endonuclease n=1 Tax=Pseudonocardia sp. Cha107L01 TaxID=3457576 RepID=UPI00403EEB99
MKPHTDSDGAAVLRCLDTGIPRTANRGASRPSSSARTPREASAAASTASTAGVRRRMQAQRTRDTRPELELRRFLHALGMRYRVDRAPLPGMRRRADLVFGPARVAVYVDGCFWHGCAHHGNRPARNSEYWEAKLDGNRRRDADTDAKLTAAGWLSLRVWEHEPVEDAAARIAASVRRRLPQRRVRHSDEVGLK